MKIKLLSNDAIVPKRADKGAAGYDLYIPRDFIVKPGRNIVPLDIAIAIPHGWEGQIRPRSGFSAKGVVGYPITGQGKYDETDRRYDADVLIGTIDESYRGNVGILLHNHESEPFMIAKGTRLAQIVFEQYLSQDFEIASELDETDRGEGGFGSTHI